jgi:NADH-quinone oxidoreductase subunit J
MLNEIAFYLFAAATLAFAVATMAVRKLVHAALCAAGTFAGLGVIYLGLGAEYVGFAQLLVYVGAIAILIVFAVLLTRGDEVVTSSRQFSSSWIMGVGASLLVLGAVAMPVLASPSLHRLAPPAPVAPVKIIGLQLMTRYALPLEMTGVLLTAALLGAVVIAMREESEIKLQSARPALQPVETVEEEICAQ